MLKGYISLEIKIVGEHTSNEEAMRNVFSRMYSESMASNTNVFFSNKYFKTTATILLS